MKRPDWWHEYSCHCEECKNEDTILEIALSDTQIVETSMVWKDLETNDNANVTDRLPLQ